MNDLEVVRRTGWFGLVSVLLLMCELPLWILPGTPPLISDAVGHSAYLAGIRVIALTRVLIDTGMYVCLMVFFAGFRHLIVKIRPECEWIGTMVFGAGAVWWAAILAANSLEGGAVLDTIGGRADPTAVRALVEGTLLIYNGPIAFALSGLFMASAGYAIQASGALPRWTAWLAWASVALCVAAIPAVFVNVVDPTRFYNVAGWGPGAVTVLPPLAWFGVTGVLMIRKRDLTVRAADAGGAA